MANLSNLNNKFLVTTGGNVGINTTLPTNLLDIKSNGNSKGLDIHHSNGNMVAQLIHGGSGDEGQLKLYDSNAETVRISGENNIASFINSGNLGIGTTSPDEMLHIENSSGANIILNSNTGAVNNGIYMSEGSNSTPTQNGAYFYYDSSANAVKLDTGTSSLSTKLTILRDSGNVGIGTSSLGTEAKLAIGAINANEGGQIVLHKGTSGTLAAHIDAYHSTNDYLRILSGTNTASSSAPFVFDLTNVRLGIGKTNPIYKLDIAGTSPRIRVAETTSNTAAFLTLKTLALILKSPVPASLI